MLRPPGVLGDLDRVRVGRPGQQPRRGQEHPARVVGDLQRYGRDLRTGRLQHRAPVRAELLRHRGQFRGDQLAQLRVRLQDRGQRLDLAVEPVALALQLDPVEAGEPTERGVQDVLRLDLAQREVRHQALLRLRRVVAVPDDPDDLVDVEEGDDQPHDHVQPVAAPRAEKLTALAYPEGHPFHHTPDRLHGKRWTRQPLRAPARSSELRAQQRGALDRRGHRPPSRPSPGSRSTSAPSRPTTASSRRATARCPRPSASSCAKWSTRRSRRVR
ncbi:hypothetical protein SMICM17S_08970 [Streptomyces microflavus]